MRELATFRARSEGHSPSPSHSSVSTPAKSPELLSLLGSIGYTLDESIAFQHRPAAPLPRLSIVMPGVGYLCEDESFLSAALQPCLEGDASFTVAAQWGVASAHTRSSDKAQCMRNYEHLVLGSKCHLLVAEQAFVPADSQQPHTPPRVDVFISIAAGRAFALSKTLHPGAKVVARVRIDTIWCLPRDLPGENTSFFTANAHGVTGHGRNANVHVFSDRYALMSADVAPYYFGAWRMHIPWANGTARRGACPCMCPVSSEATLAAVMCPLTRGRAGQKVAWLPPLPVPMIGRYNGTHFAFRGSGRRRNQMTNPQPPAYFANPEHRCELSPTDQEAADQIVAWPP